MITAGSRCVVTLGPTVLRGKVEQVRIARPHPIHVVFDDPLVFGGFGEGWFKDEQVTEEQ